MKKNPKNQDLYETTASRLSRVSFRERGGLPGKVLRARSSSLAKILLGVSILSRWQGAAASGQLNRLRNKGSRVLAINVRVYNSADERIMDFMRRQLGQREDDPLLLIGPSTMMLSCEFPTTGLPPHVVSRLLVRTLPGDTIGRCSTRMFFLPDRLSPADFGVQLCRRDFARRVFGMKTAIRREE